MPGSFGKVNYALRPAKSVERKMIAEAVRRLSPVVSTNSYTYVGMGSPFFTDFILFHRSLGIEDMTSIESQESKSPRFLLNKPFNCVAIDFGSAGDAMRRLDWRGPMILWLDYDYAINRSMLMDVKYAAKRLAPFSVLIVTADSELADDPDERLTTLIERVGTAHVPTGTTLRDLDGWGSAAVTRDILTRKIRDTLSFATAAHKDQAKREYRQLFNFQYEDSTPMVTCGGIILRRDQISAFDKIDFGGLNFVKSGIQHFRIRVPSLTYREVHYFDSLLPTEDIRSIDRKSIPLKDLQAYSGIYRFFPAFVEAEL